MFKAILYLCYHLYHFFYFDGHIFLISTFQTDNHGNHVIANEESAINIPAVAAAHVTKRYIAQAPDEISLEVGVDLGQKLKLPKEKEMVGVKGKGGYRTEKLLFGDLMTCLQ